MNKNLNILLRAAGMAALALLLVNLLAFGIQVLGQGAGADWSFRFKHAVFYIDGVPAGWALGSLQANALMLVIFLYVLFRYYRRGELTLG